MIDLGVLIIILLLVFLLSLPSAFLVYQMRKSYAERNQLKHEINQKQRIIDITNRINQIILETMDIEQIIHKFFATIPGILYEGNGIVALIGDKQKYFDLIFTPYQFNLTSTSKFFVKTINRLQIPADDESTLIYKAIRNRRYLLSNSLSEVLGLAFDRAKSEQIQTEIGAKTILVYPMFGKGQKPIGVFIALTSKQDNQIDKQELDLIQDFISSLGIVIEYSLIYDQLKNANDRLQKYDQLKDDFLSVASHELRTPMTAVRSYAWMALYKSDIKLSQKLEKYLMRILLSTERLISLVNDMLNVSHLQSGKVEIQPNLFDIHSLVSEVIQDEYLRADEKLIKIINPEVQLPNVWADSEKVRQVVFNLLDNAIKFSKARSQIEIKYFTDGKVVEVGVIDQGVGVSRDDLSRLFQKFGRLDNSYVAAATSGGTGLGLYICKSLIELMGGHIWARSKGVNQGSEFWFSLPVNK